MKAKQDHSESLGGTNEQGKLFGGEDVVFAVGWYHFTMCKLFYCGHWLDKVALHFRVSMDFHHMFTSHIKCRWSIWWAKIPSFDPKGLYIYIIRQTLIWCQSKIDLGEMPKGATTLFLVEVGLHKNTMYGLLSTSKWMADAPLFILTFTLSATKFHGTYFFWKGGLYFFYCICFYNAKVT